MQERLKNMYLIFNAFGNIDYYHKSESDYDMIHVEMNTQMGPIQMLSAPDKYLLFTLVTEIPCAEA
jgi:uncharacterized protein YqgQ